MATVYQCDRCKRTDASHNTIWTDDATASKDSRYWDLCPSCQGDLAVWMKQVERAAP